MLMQGPWGPLLPAQRFAFQMPPILGGGVFAWLPSFPSFPCWVSSLGQAPNGAQKPSLSSPQWCGLGRGSSIQPTEHTSLPIYPMDLNRHPNPFSAFSIHPLNQLSHCPSRPACCLSQAALQAGFPPPGCPHFLLTPHEILSPRQLSSLSDLTVVDREATSS